MNFRPTRRVRGANWHGDMDFQADIGVLTWEHYQSGDEVTSAIPHRGKLPYGPDANCDFTRDFWALGLAKCPMCTRDVPARVEIRGGRFSAAVPDRDLQDLFAWGYLDDVGSAE
jgi:hypothetical protein